MVGINSDYRVEVSIGHVGNLPKRLEFLPSTAFYNLKLSEIKDMQWHFSRLRKVYGDKSDYSDYIIEKFRGSPINLSHQGRGLIGATDLGFKIEDRLGFRFPGITPATEKWLFQSYSLDGSRIELKMKVVYSPIYVKISENGNRKAAMFVYTDNRGLEARVISLNNSLNEVEYEAEVSIILYLDKEERSIVIDTEKYLSLKST